jgi:hypothetical protein
MAKKGITGYVEETGQTFTIRDDYDYGNPGRKGKGYHVNAQLGKENPRAFCSTSETDPSGYEQRVQMTGERYLYDGGEQAAKWYVNRDDPKVKYDPDKAKV